MWGLGLDAGCWTLRSVAGYRHVGFIRGSRWVGDGDLNQVVGMRAILNYSKFEVGHVVAVLEMDQPPELRGRNECSGLWQVVQRVSR